MMYDLKAYTMGDFIYTTQTVRIVQHLITDDFMNNAEPGSSGSIVPGYGLDDRAIDVRSLAEAKGFFL
jgi:hypothetical protein